MSLPPKTLTENELWLLSFYRTSEISGALFFGRVARSVRPGPLQVDITHHFADEANHARWWSECIAELDADPLNLGRAYQDEYLNAAGVPANLMEVLAITQIFEKRAIGQYKRHLTVEGLHPRIGQTLSQIMVDERWHLRYVRSALRDLADEYGQEEVDTTLKRYAAADEAVFAKALDEYGERFPYEVARAVTA